MYSVPDLELEQLEEYVKTLEAERPVDMAALDVGAGSGADAGVAVSRGVQARGRDMSTSTRRS